MKTAKENDLDLVRCQYYLYKSSDNTNEPFDNTWVPMNKVYCPLDDQTPFMQAPAIWCNLFKKEMIFDNNIRFLESYGSKITNNINCITCGISKIQMARIYPINI